MQSAVEKVTVIGGSGFIGTHLCELFSKSSIDFEIVDLRMSNRFPEKCKIGDVCDLKSLMKVVTGDVIVNLAAVHTDDIKDYSKYYLTNVEGAKNVALCCSNKKIKKIVFTSSVAVYGFAPPGTSEDGAINPFNHYGKTKFLAEEKLRCWQKKKDNSLIIVRPTVIFGEGNRGNVYNLFNQISSRRFLMIGKGQNIKSMAYVGNVAAFLTKCIFVQKDFALFNYVDAPEIDMNTLVREVRKKLKNIDHVGLRIPYWLGIIIGYMADIFAKITNKKLPISTIRVKKFCATTQFSSSRSDFGDYQQPFNLYEGINRTLISDFLDKTAIKEVFYTE